MLRKNPNLNRWRALQASRSSLHRKNGRRICFIRCLFFVAICSFMLLALHMLRNLNEYYEANVVINYHRGPHGASARIPPRDEFFKNSRDKGKAVVAGISLDHVGDLVLHDPDHKLCEARLYFVEQSGSLGLLSVALRDGTTMAADKSESLDSCCNLCSSKPNSCHGFRFETRTRICSLLNFGQTKMSNTDIDFTQSMKPKFFAQQRARVLAERRQAGAGRSITTPQKPSRSSLKGGASGSILHSQVQDSDELQIPEPTPGFALEEEVTSATEDNDMKSDSSQDAEAEENQLELEDDSPSSAVAEPNEDTSVNSNSEEDATTSPPQQADKKGALSSTDMMFEIDNVLESQPVLEQLPEELKQIDHTGEGEQLREFLGMTGLPDAVMSSETDQALMKQLMDELNTRHSPKKEPVNVIKKKVKSWEEKQKPQSSNEELGHTRPKKIIPLGDYNRLTARDQVYGQNKNVWLRYRTNREIQNVAQEMANFHKKDVSFVTIGKSGAKKPQYIKSLRVGNGRRGKHVFVVATLRGCEWTSSLAVLHTAMVLKGRGQSTKSLLDSVQFHFIPLANPDGFDFSHHKTPATARAWCKNRRVAVPGYHGVDLEHNWGLDGISWGFGKRDGAKLDNFQGPSNFSEPETRALRSYMRHYATGRGRVALLHVKCCSAMISPPQIYRDIDNPVGVSNIANMLSRQMEMTDGSKYPVQKRPTQFSSKNHGNIIDYAHNEMGIDHAYSVELKGAGLATRTDKTKISIEPLQTLLRELETATVFVAQKLLLLPIEGDPVNVPYKPKFKQQQEAAAASASSKTSSTSAKTSSKSSTSNSKTASKSSSSSTQAKKRKT